MGLLKRNIACEGSAGRENASNQGRLGPWLNAVLAGRLFLELAGVDQWLRTNVVSWGHQPRVQRAFSLLPWLWPEE